MSKFGNRLNISLMSANSRKVVRTVDGALQRCLGKTYAPTIGKIKEHIRYRSIRNHVVSEETFQSICWPFPVKHKGSYQPLVSIIVPNYNHEAYLVQRLDTIYAQTYKNVEILLLDDCSTDYSRDILIRYANAHSDTTRCLFRDENCGNTYKQWKYGIEAAKGELIWIAESDDYSEPTFLETMVGLMADESVRLAFARSAFMQEGKQIWSTEEYLMDLPMLKFDQPFYMTAHNLVRFGFAVHNVIPNVSSALFRHPGEISADTDATCLSMELSADWIFYLSVINGGIVAYTNSVTNYYRVHGESTSLRIQKTDRYYTEFAQVSAYVLRHYHIEDTVLQQIQNNLQKHFLQNRPGEDPSHLQDLYSATSISKASRQYLPHVALGCYALRSGGGETYPVYLANAFCHMGYPVTLINFNIEDTDERIRALVDSRVPLITMSNRNDIAVVIEQLGADILHTHHAYIDELAAVCIERSPNLCKHVVSLHGMYETIPAEAAQRVIKKVYPECTRFIYIADKNLQPFRDISRFPDARFIKLANAVPKKEIHPISREKLGFAEDDFVFVLASRGLIQKGWLEAIQAVKMVNEELQKENQKNTNEQIDKVHTKTVRLIILGDGEAMLTAKVTTYAYVRFMGTVTNVMDYFAMGNMGLLPTYYKGESFPLSVAECLMAGKPVLATDVAEIKNQLTASDGSLAGVVFPLTEGRVDSRDLANCMLDVIRDEENYKALCMAVAGACGKFDMETIANKHIRIYKEAYQEGKEVC